MREFLPETLDGWVGLTLGALALLSAAVGAVVKWVRTPLTQQINGLGERVNTLEISDAKEATRLEKLEAESATARFERSAMIERTSRLEKSTENLLTAVTLNRENGMEENGEIRERLARIESKVDDLRPKQR